MSTESRIPAVPYDLGNFPSRIEKAIAFAKELNQIVSLEFNGTTIYIGPGCSAEVVMLNWDEIMRARSNGAIQSNNLYTDEEHGVLEVTFKPRNS